MTLDDLYRPDSMNLLRDIWESFQQEGWIVREHPFLANANIMNPSIEPDDLLICEQYLDDNGLRDDFDEFCSDYLAGVNDDSDYWHDLQKDGEL